MNYDDWKSTEPSDGSPDPHAECTAEIEALEQRVRELEQELARLRGQMRLLLLCDVQGLVTGY